MPNRSTPLLIASGILLILSLAHVCLGSSVVLNPIEVWRHTVHGGELQHILVELRLPRVLSSILGGASLAAAGYAFQAFFRNPLAEPYVLGVSGGASIGGGVAAVLGLFSLSYGLAGPLIAAGCGLATLPIAMALGRVPAGRSTSHLLIGGVVLGTLLASLNTLILLLSGLDTNQVLRWLLGSVSNVIWPQVAILAFFCLTGISLLQTQVRALQLIAISESQSKVLGVNPKHVGRTVLFTGTLLTAMVVGCLGIIGFIGLVGPHIARQWSSKANPLLLSALIGGSLLVGADLLSQRLMEIPVGAVTAVLGAPVLLSLLRRN